MLHSHTWAYGGQCGQHDFLCAEVCSLCCQGDHLEENYNNLNYNFSHAHEETPEIHSRLKYCLLVFSLSNLSLSSRTIGSPTHPLPLVPLPTHPTPLLLSFSILSLASQWRGTVYILVTRIIVKFLVLVVAASLLTM